jgi:hypothetical protein
MWGSARFGGLGIGFRRAVVGWCWGGGKSRPGDDEADRITETDCQVKKNVTAAKLTLSMEPVNPTAIGFSLIGKINS